MKLSAAFPPVLATPDHIALAEELGYETAWVYDTPALQLDCWMTLAIAATRTRRIRLGPGVMIPSLRHPMVTASAIATLVSLVGPSRVIVGIGTGFTGRRAMGQKPLRWQDMPRYVGDIRALLAGETVEIDGAPARMLHWPDQAPKRPIEVPIVLGVNGPKGLASAESMGLGVFTSRPRSDAVYDKRHPVILLGFGTVMDEGESVSSQRVIDTAGPGIVVAYHAFLEQRDARLAGLPNAERFIALANAGDPRQRHLIIHEGHLTELNAIDRQVIGGQVIGTMPLVCKASELPGRLAGLAAQGITEVAFQPAGDIRRELTAFARAAGLARPA
jgi:5,10-methylenetetrahydromethanopterin reductase